MINKGELHVTPLFSKCEYSYFTNLKYMGHGDGMVKLEDSKGNKKEVYISLFCKYGAWID